MAVVEAFAFLGGLATILGVIALMLSLYAPELFAALAGLVGMSQATSLAEKAGNVGGFTVEDKAGRTKSVAKKGQKGVLPKLSKTAQKKKEAAGAAAAAVAHEAAAEEEGEDAPNSEDVASAVAAPAPAPAPTAAVPEPAAPAGKKKKGKASTQVPTAPAPAPAPAPAVKAAPAAAESKMAVVPTTITAPSKGRNGLAPNGVKHANGKVAPSSPEVVVPAAEELSSEALKRKAKKAAKKADKAAAAPETVSPAPANSKTHEPARAAEEEGEDWEVVPQAQKLRKERKAGKDDAPAEKKVRTAREMMALYAPSKPVAEKAELKAESKPETQKEVQVKSGPRAGAWGQPASEPKPKSKRVVKAEEDEETTGVEDFKTEDENGDEIDKTEDEKTDNERDDKKTKVEEDEFPLEVVEVEVPQEKRGRCIGPRGVTLQFIIDKSGCKRIDTLGSTFTIKGSAEACEVAAKALTEMVERGYMTCQYEDFGESTIDVPRSSIPELIGKQGSVVRKLKEEFSVEINFPKDDKPAPVAELGENEREARKRAKEEKVTVTIVGEADGVAKAQQVMREIVEFHHSELTHPGYTHEEIDVESRLLSFLIGRKGSEMRHIQGTFKVEVNIGESMSDVARVQVIGRENNVTRCKQYIERLFESVDSRMSKREKDEENWQNEENWQKKDREEPDEKWMSQYLIKR